MKTIFFFFSLLLLATGLNAQRDQFTVEVDGLGCPFCAYGLEANFKEVPGITKIKIDLEGGILRFEVPAANKLSTEAVQKQVTNAGYTARHISVKRADGQIEEMEVAPTMPAQINVDSQDNNSDVVALNIAVGGSCDMCKERIESTAMGIEGVQSANWDLASKTLSLRMSPGASAQAVQHALAMAGHDTPIAKADKKTYKALPMCCQYR